MCIDTCMGDLEGFRLVRKEVWSTIHKGKFVHGKTFIDIDTGVTSEGSIPVQKGRLLSWYKCVCFV